MDYDDYAFEPDNRDYYGDEEGSVYIGQSQTLFLLLAAAVVVVLLASFWPTDKDNRKSSNCREDLARKVPSWMKSDVMPGEPEPERHPEKDGGGQKEGEPDERPNTSNCIAPPLPPGEISLPELWAKRAPYVSVHRHPYPVYRVSFRGGVDLSLGPGCEFGRAGVELQYEEQFAVTAMLHGPDRRIYLRLTDGRGWAYDDSEVFPEDPSVELIMEQAGSVALRPPPDEPPSVDVVENLVAVPNARPTPEDPLAGSSPRSRIVVQNWGIVTTQEFKDTPEPSSVQMPSSFADWVNDQRQRRFKRNLCEDFGDDGLHRRSPQQI